MGQIIAAQSPDESFNPANSTWVVPRRWVVVAFTVLVLGAFGVRLLSYDRYLPAFDYSDESVPFLVGLTWRGIVNNEWLDWRYGGYPPAYVLINIGVQELVESVRTKPWTTPPEYFYALRLLAVFVGTITVLVVASIGWQLSGPIAGWIAGFVWAFAPIIVEHNSLAIPDPFVYLTAALAVTTALRAWRVESPRWLLASLICGILAIYFKLWPIHTLIPWGIVTLILLRRHPRRMIPWIGGYILIGIVAAAYLFGVVRPLSDLPAREIETFNSSGVSLMLTPSRNIINWGFAVYPIGNILFYLVAGGTIVAALYSRRKGWETPNWQWVTVLLLYSVAGVMMASSFTQVRLAVGKIRHVLPMSAVLLPLWGAGIVVILQTIKNWSVSRSFTLRQQHVFLAVLPVIIGVGLVPYYVSANIEIAQRFQKEQMRALLWHWSDVNVPVDGLILVHPLSNVAHTWNREWSGYDGTKPFSWWLEDEKEILASTTSEYLERGIVYFVLDEEDVIRYFSTPEGTAFLQQLALIKTFPASADIDGSTVYFYRFAPPQYTAHAVYGDQIVLAGYDMETATFTPGDTIIWRPYWRTLRLPHTNYSMFVHLYRQNETDIIVQHDGAPTNAARPTLTWDDVNELYIGSDVTLTLPTDLAVGEYQLAIGLYDYQTGERLKLDTGDDFFTIPITVQDE